MGTTSGPKCFSLAASLLLAACSGPTAPVATGGAIGTLAGAGTGALVGAAISSGDIAASALLGGAIGLPVGLALGYSWKRQTEDAQARSREQQYIANQRAIMEREEEIQLMREDMMREIPRNRLSDSEKQHIYVGPSLGVPTRGF
ncbi:MAG: hypothetical protein J5J00_07830 [Deltaproteobacteria bacterium]|nr:hypothetical protein [Deltaproteobacteria bacterium]